jgi:hypothetical protein
MEYTEEQVKEAMSEWAGNAYDAPEDFGDVIGYDTKKEYVDKSVETLMKYLEGLN